MAAAALAVSQGVTNGPLSFFPEKKNYTDASAHCVGAGGHLASVHTPAENAVLADLCSAEECWIGFNDIEEEGLWVWKDGTDADFSKFPGGNPPWNPGEPNGQAWEKTDGAYVYPATNKWVQAGTWDDDDIAKKKSFVCRFADAPWAPPPPPSPPPLTHITTCSRKGQDARKELEAEMNDRVQAVSVPKRRFLTPYHTVLYDQYPPYVVQVS